MSFNFQGKMIPRRASKEILSNLTYFPIAGIIGPRQVGKTTLAKQLREQLPLESIYLDLELESDLRKLDDAETYLNLHRDKCIIIDEVQRMPSLFALLRALVDQDRRPARFIILGSASPELIRASSESLAGRIAYTELTPFSLLEISDKYSLRAHWLAGGFPNALLAPEAKFRSTWLDNFLRTFIERDLRELGHEVSSVLLRRMLKMIAHHHGGILNQSDLSRSLGVSSPTVNRYLDLLEGSFVIQRLQPYYVNVGKRLVKSPKIYIRDSGILHNLLQIHSQEQLLGNIAVGASWEGYVIEQIRRSLPGEPELFFYRTHAKAEIDLLASLSSGKQIAFEIKLSNAPKVPKGFYQSIKDVQPAQKFVVIPEGEPYPKSEGIEVVNLPYLLNTVLPKLT
jgi:predicted AAA+ superfamily ATPase